MKRLNEGFVFVLSMVLVLSQILAPVMAQDLSNQGDAEQEGIRGLGIEHKIESLSDDCKREIKGSITFKAPKPSRKPLDLVIVQDRSASFKSTFKSMKKDLNRIIDDFTTEEDRVMITSYAGGNQYNFYDKKDSNSQVNLEELETLEDNSEYLEKNFTFKKDDKRNIKGVEIKHSELSSNKDNVKKFIEKMEILKDGNTPSALGLKEALEKYNELKGNTEDRETIFLFITDGIANVDLQGKRHLVYKEVEDSDGTMKASTYVNADIIKPHVSDMVKMGEEIKKSGYYLATSFILQDRDEERINSKNPRFENYDKHFAYSEKAFKSMASGENYYIKARELEDKELESGKDSEFYVGIEEMLSNLIEDINKKTLELDISDNYDIDSFDIENIKGLEIEDKNGILKVDEDSKKIIIDIRNLTPGGEYTINYKLNELEFNADGDENFLPGFIKVGKIDSNGKLSEERYKFEGIELEKNDKDLCKIDISKKVNDKEEDLIDEENNEIIYETEVKVKSSDDLKNLEIIEEYDDEFLEEIKEDNIKVYYKDENGNKNPLEVGIVIEKGKVISKIKEEDLPKLKDKTIIVESKTKIKEEKTNEDILKKYEDGKIPSDSKIKYKYGEENAEDTEKSSNEVNIITKNEDKDKNLKEVVIKKVDSNNKEKTLAGAEFTVEKKENEDQIGQVPEYGDQEPPTGDDEEKFSEVFEFTDSQDDDAENSVSDDNDDSSDEEKGKYITNESGLVSLGKLEEGTYTITETKAPEGYEKLEKDLILEIKVNESGDLVYTFEDREINPNGKEKIILDIGNKKIASDGEDEDGDGKTPGEGDGETPGEDGEVETPGEGENGETPGEGEDGETPGEDVDEDDNEKDKDKDEGNGEDKPGEGEDGETPGEGGEVETPGEDAEVEGDKDKDKDNNGVPVENDRPADKDEEKPSKPVIPEDNDENKKEVTIVDKNNKPVKPGQDYVIKDNNGKIVVEGIVDKDGKIVIEKLPAGRYEVEGLEDDYILVVTEDGDYIISIVEHKNPDSVGNVSDDQDYIGDIGEEVGETSVGEVLPRTGQGTNLLVLLLGIILVSLGFYSLKKSY